MKKKIKERAIIAVGVKPEVKARYEELADEANLTLSKYIELLLEKNIKGGE